MTSNRFSSVALNVETSAMDVPIIYADALYHVTWGAGVVKITFVQNLADPIDEDEKAEPADTYRARHVVTIAMPFSALLGAFEYLNGALPQLLEAYTEASGRVVTVEEMRGAT